MVLRAVLCCACFLLFNQENLNATDWPSFRGPSASGIAEDAELPLNWNGETGENIRWKTAIPGLGHSSPTVAGDRIFITSATSKNANPSLKVGLYGESPEHPEDYEHQFRLYCLDKNSGKILWERVARSGKPQVKRHLKSSHANCTPATGGKHVLAFFGSEGLYCYDVDGKLLWQKDFGYLDAGAFNDPTIQWGFGSSPIIYKDKVVVLCDVNNQSFLTTLDLKTGEQIWRTDRDEFPTWGTPTVVEHKGVAQIVVNGYKHIGGYNLENGEAIWRLKGGGDVPVPTPITADGLAFITNAHGAPSPLFAINLDATGDISLKEGQNANEGVAWRHLRRGAYMSTPIVYRDFLYVGNNRGVLTCFDAGSGKQIYRTRLAGKGGAYTASPVAGNGKLYFTDEEGDIHVIKAGSEYKLLATNPMGEVCLATPAISGDMMIVRTSKHLVGIGDTGGERLAVGPKAKPELEKIKVAKGPDPTGIEVDVKDPVSILTKVDAVARSIDKVSYHVVMEGLGAMVERAVYIEADVLASGSTGEGPEKYRVSASLVFPGEPNPMKGVLSCSGDTYYGLYPQKKTLYKDWEYSVLGDLGVAGRALVYEFHHAQPFTEEIGADQVRLVGSKNIGGVDCWEIFIVYKGARPGNETVWFIGKEDFLPRGRINQFKVEGKDGGFSIMLSHLKVNPEMRPEDFELSAPDGYSVSDKALER